MATRHTRSGRRHVSPETLSRLKHMDEVRRHSGHAHFCDRAVSRRQFVQTTAAFRSDPASTSQVVYAEVGEERNGFFFF
jgi:hypothetical protein